MWSVARGGEIGVSVGGAARLVQAQQVIIATGALERPMPIPGWSLPGVMTVGAAQILLKSAGLLGEGRVVLAGSGPLLWRFAQQHLAAGRRDRCAARHDAAGQPLARRPSFAGLPGLGPMRARG